MERLIEEGAPGVLSISELDKIAKNPEYKIMDSYSRFKNKLIGYSLLGEDGSIQNFVKNIVLFLITFADDVVILGDLIVLKTFKI